MNKIFFLKLMIISSLLMFSFPAWTADEKPRTESAGTDQRTIQKGQEQDGRMIVARINGSPVFMNELINMMNRIRGMESSPKNPEEIKQKALDTLIFQELAVQKAIADGLKPDASKVETTLATLKSRLGESGYEQFLDRENLDEAGLRQRIERNSLLELIFAREVRDKSKVPEDEIRQEYERNRDKFLIPEKVLVTDVVFLLDTGKRETDEKVKEILNKVLAGESRDPWKLTLDGTFAVRDLELTKDIDEELHKEAIRMKEGELRIVNTHDSVHIIKLRKYTPEKQISLEQARRSIEGKLLIKSQKKRLRAWETELKKEAGIEIVKIDMVKTGD